MFSLAAITDLFTGTDVTVLSVAEYGLPHALAQIECKGVHHVVCVDYCAKL